MHVKYKSFYVIFPTIDYKIFNYLGLSFWKIPHVLRIESFIVGYTSNID